MCDAVASKNLVDFPLELSSPRQAAWKSVKIGVSRSAGRRGVFLSSRTDLLL